MFLSTNRCAPLCAMAIALSALAASLSLAPRAAWAQNPWQNPLDRIDVTGDGVRAADDFHIEYNELMFRRIADPITGILPKPATPPPFYDVNGDPIPAINPVDYLNLINALVNDPSSFLAGVPPEAVTTKGPASVRFEFRSDEETPLDTVSVGDEFFLTAIVGDDREEPLGVFANYIDVLYNTALADLAGEPIFDAGDALVAEGTLTAAGIEEIGSMSQAANQLAFENFPTVRDAFSIPLRASAEGELVADGANGYVLLLGIDKAISPSFVPDTLTIVPEPAAIALVMPILMLGRLSRRNESSKSTRRSSPPNRTSS